MTSFFLSFVAGTLGSLSPCVLPALPLVVGSASQKHRYGPLVLALGMILSFTLVGVLLSATGSFLGLSDTSLRMGAALLLILAGIALVSSALQERLAVVSSPITSGANHLLNRFSPEGLKGQFLVGTLLGAVWAPCTGPALGAAVGLAADASTRLTATLLMLVFGVGAAFPLLIAGYGSRRAFSSPKFRALTLRAKPMFGLILVVFGLLSLSGLDERLEAVIFGLLPSSVLEVLTRF